MKAPERKIFDDMSSLLERAFMLINKENWLRDYADLTIELQAYEEACNCCCGVNPGEQDNGEEI